MFASILATLLTDRNPLPIHLLNLSETQYARFGSVLFSERRDGLFLNSAKDCQPTVVLTKYDNLTGSAYAMALRKFSSLQIDLVGRCGTDGRFRWWTDQGKPIDGKSVEDYKPFPKTAKDSLLVLVSAENLFPRNAIIDQTQGWDWVFGRLMSKDMIAHFGRTGYWVSISDPPKDRVTIPIWLSRYQRAGDILPPLTGSHSNAIGIDIEVKSVEGQTVTLRQYGQSAIGFFPRIKSNSDQTYARTGASLPGGITDWTFYLECSPKDCLGFEFYARTLYFGYLEGIPTHPLTR